MGRHDTYCHQRRNAEMELVWSTLCVGSLWNTVRQNTVGAPVEREEQDVQEDMEEEGMEQVDDMGESDGMESSEEAVDLSGSSEGAADGFRGGRLRTPPLSRSR